VLKGLAHNGWKNRLFPAPCRNPIDALHASEIGARSILGAMVCPQTTSRFTCGIEDVRHRGDEPLEERQVHAVRLEPDEVVLPPVHDAAVMAEADRLSAVVDAREDLDRRSLADVREARHDPAAWAPA